MAEDTSRIEITFPVAVELTRDDQRVIDAITAEICRRYERAHPGRVMWPAGVGSKVTYMPMTKAEEEAGRHMEFDNSVFAIDVAERADWSWACAKCGKEQGDHEGCIIDPPAGDCEFEPVKKDLGPEPDRGVVPMRVYESAVHGRSEMRRATVQARAHAGRLHEALSGLVEALAANDEDGLTEFAEPMAAARAALQPLT